MKFTPIVIIQQLSSRIITLLAHGIIRLFLIVINPGTFYLSKSKLDKTNLVFVYKSRCIKQATDG